MKKIFSLARMARGKAKDNIVRFKNRLVEFGRRSNR